MRQPLFCVSGLGVDDAYGAQAVGAAGVVARGLIDLQRAQVIIQRPMIVAQIVVHKAGGAQRLGHALLVAQLLVQFQGEAENGQGGLVIRLLMRAHALDVQGGGAAFRVAAVLSQLPRLRGIVERPLGIDGELFLCPAVERIHPTALVGAGFYGRGG